MTPLSIITVRSGTLFICSYQLPCPVVLSIPLSLLSTSSFGGVDSEVVTDHSMCCHIHVLCLDTHYVGVRGVDGTSVFIQTPVFK